MKNPVRTPGFHGFCLEDQVMINLTLANPSGREQAFLNRNVQSTLDWELLWETIRLNDVAPLVHSRLQALGLLNRIPAEVRNPLEKRHLEITERNRHRLIQTTELFRRFHAAGVSVIVLKGVLFAETIYHDIGYKKMNDLDLLVPFRDVEKVKVVYRETGLIPLALLEGGDEPLDENRNYHLPACISRDLTFVVGTHWNLCSPKRGFAISMSELWARSVPVSIGETPVRALSIIDVLHHLIVHFHYYKNGLKELADFANWIRAHEPFPWDLMKSEIDRAKTWTPAFRTLSLVSTIYGTAVPEDLLQSCSDHSEPWTRRDTQKLLHRKDLLLRSRSTYSSEIEKAYLSFTFENRFEQKLPLFFTFWVRLLFPPLEILHRTNSVRPGEHSWLWLWTLNLWRTSREVGKTYGLAIFFLLMGKSLAELATSGFGRQPDRMAELREELGTDEKRIRELLNSMD